LGPLLHISALDGDGFGVVPDARGQRVPPGARHHGIYSSALLKVDFLEVFSCQSKTESLRPCRALLELPLDLDRPRAGYPIYDYSQGCILTLLEDLGPLAIPYGGASLGEQRWQIIPDLVISATDEFSLGISQLFSIISHSLAMPNMDFFLPRNRGALEAVGSRETEHVLGRR